MGALGSRASNICGNAEVHISFRYIRRSQDPSNDFDISGEDRRLYMYR
jgi:hypothetical protein